MRSIVTKILGNHNIPPRAHLLIGYHQIGVTQYDFVRVSTAIQLALHLDNMYKFKKHMLEQATLYYKDKNYTVVISEYIETRESQEFFRRISQL